MPYSREEAALVALVKKTRRARGRKEEQKKLSNQPNEVNLYFLEKRREGHGRKEKKKENPISLPHSKKPSLLTTKKR